MNGTLGTPSRLGKSRPSSSVVARWQLRSQIQLRCKCWGSGQTVAPALAAWRAAARTVSDLAVTADASSASRE
jgi:hypothetical protein